MSKVMTGSAGPVSAQPVLGQRSALGGPGRAGYLESTDAAANPCACISAKRSTASALLSEEGRQGTAAQHIARSYLNGTTPFSLAAVAAFA